MSSCIRRKGFTLIELLIVVAIIAILAAIAVPNFLEAQVRAKVSRAKADERTLATALEAYSVDHGKYPPTDNMTTQKGTLCGPSTTLVPANVRAEWCYSLLTTPVSYTTSIPLDPFRDKGSVNKKAAGGGAAVYSTQKYVYDGYFCPHLVAPAATAFANGYAWSLISIGPSRNSGSGGSANIVMGIVYGAVGGTLFHYDPSNGTASSGYIIRTNKGDFSGPSGGYTILAPAS